MTPATDAVREARAREIAWKLVIGEKVGGGDGQTYVGRTPTVSEIEAALLAFADTEAASQPREGDGERLRDLYAIHEAWPVDKHPRNGAPSEEWEPYYAANRARKELLAAIPALLLTQRPPEQAGAVLAGEPFGYWVEQKHADPVLLRKPAYIPEPSDLRTVTPLYAAPTPPDAGPGEIPAGMVASVAVERIATAVMRWGRPHFKHMVAYSTLCEAIEKAIFSPGATAQNEAERQCPSSPDGRHQVDTSMEGGPNNCFHCSEPMGDRHAR